MRGKKTPTKIKKLKGTLEKSRILKNEMLPTVATDVAKFPTQLINNFAQDEWSKITLNLSQIGMLFETDTSMLLAYCNEIGIYFNAIQEMKKNGFTQKSQSNGEILSNNYKIGNTALQNAMKLSDKFGFNPAARTKIEMPEKKDVDPIDEL